MFLLLGEGVYSPWKFRIIIMDTLFDTCLADSVCKLVQLGAIFSIVEWKSTHYLMQFNDI